MVWLNFVMTSVCLHNLCSIILVVHICTVDLFSWHQANMFTVLQQRDARTEDVYLQVASLAIGPSEVRFQGSVFCPTNRQWQVKHLKIEQQLRFCTSVFAISSPAQSAWMSWSLGEPLSKNAQGLILYETSIRKIHDASS